MSPPLYPDAVPHHTKLAVRKAAHPKKGHSCQPRAMMNQTSDPTGHLAETSETSTGTTGAIRACTSHGMERERSRRQRERVVVWLLLPDFGPQMNRV
jgi:hypothetical protein